MHQNLLTEDNFLTSYLRFENRQAGISVVYSPEDDVFYYNAYCIDMELLKELFSVEFTTVDEALETINAEFGKWDLANFEEKSGCSSCAAK